MLSKVGGFMYRNLFPFEEVETRGKFYAFKMVELIVLLFTIKFAYDWGFYIQRIGEVVLPLGIAQYIDVSFMFSNNISVVNGAIMIIAALAGFFRLSRYAYAICFASFHLHYVSRYCLGEISHGSNLIGMAIFIFAVGHIAFQEGKNFRVFSMGMAHFYFGMGYTSAGICKLIGTGPTWIDGSHLWMWIGERSVDVTSRMGEFAPNFLQEWILANHTFATVVLLFGLMAELASFLLWFRFTRPWATIIVIGMHQGISTSMNILFLENMIILIAVGLPWYILFDRFLPGNPSTAEGSGSSPGISPEPA